ncbi:helix-turn-helix domain-containing protein [Flavobacterium sp.]|uniref:helix-turn-helix domain-containing protein n=1 Tax=Flavobacterium sp. TaxID=239 RepID=UPI004033C010
MNIDRSEFIGWMHKIMERFDILMDAAGVSKQHVSAIDGEELLDNQDVLHMLKISSRSLQRYRSSGRLPYYTISGKLYYKLSDIHQFIRESFNPKSRNKDNG